MGSTLVLIGFICFILAIIIGLITLFTGNELCEILFSVLFFTYLIIMLGSCACDEVERENKIEYSLEHNYTCYIDGEEVDPSLIDIDNYRHITFDDENERIIIASTGR